MCFKSVKTLGGSPFLAVKKASAFFTAKNGELFWLYLIRINLVFFRMKQLVPPLIDLLHLEVYVAGELSIKHMLQSQQKLSSPTQCWATIVDDRPTLN